MTEIFADLLRCRVWTAIATTKSKQASQKGNREAKALYEERMAEGVNTGGILKEETVGAASEISRGRSQREM